METLNSLFIKNCGEKVFSEKFASIYSEAVRECDESGVFFLEEKYIRAVNDETGAYPRILELLVDEATRVKKDRSLMRYALFVYRAMTDRTNFLSYLSSFELPPSYELFAFLTLIPMIKKTYDTLVGLGLAPDIVSATVGQYEECTFIYERRYDRIGMNKRYFDWLQHYVDCEILNINRLRFEIHTLKEPILLLRELSTGDDRVVICDGEFGSQGLYSDTPPNTAKEFCASFTETESDYIVNSVSKGGRAERETAVYPKSQYAKIIEKGDTLLSVHIPVEGELSVESCRESYRRAAEVFDRHFPSLDVKGFVCYSWMMSPELADHLKPSSRVLGFASHYLRFPIHTEGEDVLNFVFYLKFKDYTDLKEDTSLQRSLKRLYLSGGRLYEYGGIFARDKI